MSKTYYPEYERKVEGERARFSTTIRKKKGNTWREFDVVETFFVDQYTEAEMIDQFHKNCYRYLVSMEIPKLGVFMAEKVPFQPWTKTDMFPKSEIQISEKERLTMKLS